MNSGLDLENIQVTRKAAYLLISSSVQESHSIFIFFTGYHSFCELCLSFCRHIHLLYWKIDNPLILSSFNTQESLVYSSISHFQPNNPLPLLGSNKHSPAAPSYNKNPPIQRGGTQPRLRSVHPLFPFPATSALLLRGKSTSSIRPRGFSTTKFSREE